MNETEKRIYEMLKKSKTHKEYRERLIFLGKMTAPEITTKLKKLAVYLASHPFADYSISYAGVFGLTMPSGFKPTDPTDETLPQYVDTGDEAVLPSFYMG